MNAFKILSIICFSFFTAVALAKITYNPNQLQQFEKTNQCVNCDLSNAYLVYENHSQANLDKTNLSGTEASRIDLSGAT